MKPLEITIDDLYPFSLTHDVGELRTGFYTQRERIERGGPSVRLDSLWTALASLAEHISVDAGLMKASGLPLIHPDARIAPNAVLDDTNGPIIIDDGAVIEPFVYIKGPVTIGRNSVIRSMARIYGPTVIGPVCRIGGEVHDTIFLGYANKQHDGFVGHSVIGEWCNLGANTTTSNLKVNYGEVSATLPTGTVRTGTMFLGTLMGDHTKTAIGTMLSTGTVIGACSSIVTDGFPPRFVPSFTWKENETMDEDKAIELARTVMQRRGMTLSSDMERRLRLISHERRNGRIL